ncbi:unnamed protein product [Auanema sp. JU1783]|nr:unnamed protein product [Auanema sp. JU1783]
MNSFSWKIKLLLLLPFMVAVTADGIIITFLKIKIKLIRIDFRVGKCDSQRYPASWLLTSATGITNWATASYPLGGKNFCLEGNHTEKTVKVAYHVDTQAELVSRTIELTSDNPNNLCVTDDPRIQYCFAFCEEERQKQVINNALASGNLTVVASKIARDVHDRQYAVTVLDVDYNDPNTRLNVSVFLDAAWCSVYIGINPNEGTPYLYEIQVAKILIL